MTGDLLSRRCVPCRGGVARTPGWTLVDEGRHIERKFCFKAITIHITATPSFDAAARWLLQTNLFPIAPPFLQWADIMRAWQPWLPVSSGPTRSLPEPE
jgi:hypothetical protein